MTFRLFNHISRKVGTPYQLYHEQTIIDRNRELMCNFRAHFPKFKQFFAVKALPNPAILKIMLDQGCGLDCSSPTELYIAKKLNVPSDKIIYTSNFTSEKDVKMACAHNVILNLDDISLIDFIPKNKIPDTLSFRLNPQTNQNWNKFGMTEDNIIKAYERILTRSQEEASVVKFGIHMMNNSCELDIQKWEVSVRSMMETVSRLQDKVDINFEFVNIGGGIGIPYRPDEKEISLCQLASTIANLFKEYEIDSNLYTENGRYITGPAGYLVSKCDSIKVTNGETIYGLDACMAHLMRPGMYGAYHEIMVPKKDDREHATASVVGTLCENNDWFAKDRELPVSEIGDLFVICDTGAHAHSMGFNYNGKLKAPEILITKENGIKVIRKRETMESQFDNCCDIDILVRD